jgi:NDP-sugar pyrophosphorylase family protein
MILAAGLGSRLQPLTGTMPKALVPVCGKPMIQHLIERLFSFGITDYVVNVHHHAAILRDFLLNMNIEGVHIEFSDETDALLDTGGALKRASGYFSDGKPFLVHNVDVWTDMDPLVLASRHQQSGALATLAVRNRETSRHLLFDEHLDLCGWENRLKGERIIKKRAGFNFIPLAFSGISVINPLLFDYFPDEDRFSLIDLLLQAASTEKITGFRHDNDRWSDLGTIDRINSISQ